MPWPFDDSSNPLLDGLIAGKKFAALEEELAMAKLQRADYEASASYREQQRTLNLALLELRKRNEGTQNELSSLQLERERVGLQKDQATFQEFQENRPLRRRSARAETSRDVSEARRAATQAETAKQVQPLEIEDAQNKLSASRAQLLNNQLVFARTTGQVSPGINAQDASILAESLGEQLGVKSPSAKTFWSSVILGEAQQKQQELEANRAQLSAYKQQEATSQFKMAQDFLSLPPETVQGVLDSGMFKEDDPIYRAAKQALKLGGTGFGLQRKEAEFSPFERAMQEGQAKQIFDLQSKISEQEDKVQAATTEAATTFWTTTAKKKVASEQKYLDQLKSKLADLQKAAEGSSTKPSKKGKQAPQQKTEQDIADEVIAEHPDWTDEQIIAEVKRRLKE